MQSQLPKFYQLLLEFLFKNDIESNENVIGCSADEIENFERSYEVKLPEAYKLFQKYFGNSDLKFFDNQSYKLKNVDWFRETYETLNNLKPSEEIFVFSEWQGYNYFYFNLNNGENPEVILGIISNDDSKVNEVNELSQGCFTDWLCKRVEVSLKFRSQMQGLDTSQLTPKLERIRNIVHRC